MSKRAPKIEVAAAICLCLVFAGAAFGQDLSGLYRITDGVSRAHVEYRGVKIPPGKELSLAQFQGPGKATYFYFTDDSGGKLYQGLVLKVFWDEEKEPSIQVPLADFFGAIGGKTIDYQSSPMQINHLCYMCWLPMPFSRQARFLLANDGDKEYAHGVAYGIDCEQDQQYAREKSRLHCMWRRSNPVQGGAPPLDRLIDPSQCGGKNNYNTRHTILDVKGRGQYVGDFLQVYTKNRSWWGEGVTIFHLDGKTFVHSPGTEDEYGSCWGFGGTFSSPYCGYLQNERGNNRMYRWYVPNPVRFQKSLKVEIQDIGEFGPGSDDLTSVAFWYQEEPHQPFALQPFAERAAQSNARASKK